MYLRDVEEQLSEGLGWESVEDLSNANTVSEHSHCETDSCTEESDVDFPEEQNERDKQTNTITIVNLLNSVQMLDQSLTMPNMWIKLT